MISFSAFRACHSRCRDGLLLLTVSVACFPSVLRAAQKPLVAERPNLVFIIADDMTYRDIGCYGGQAHTPNIDRLATEGMQFQQCFQAAPMCSPTRHNIYTGLYPVKSGAYPNHTFAKSGTKSVAHYLGEAGYRVALSGKRHIGPQAVFPFEYSGKKNPDMQAIDDLMAESKDAGTPFCLFACSNEPHTPWNLGDASRYPPESVELPPYIADTPVVRDGFSRYLAEITYYDSQVGQILRMLDQHQLAENTLVMVVSEQGNSMPFAKWTCYGNGLQSAMIVRWPGHVAPASKTEAMVEYVDVLPTFLQAAGVNIPSHLDGESFIAVLKGETEQHKQHSFGMMTTRGINDGSDMYAIRTVRDQRYRLIWNLNHQTTFTNACTTSVEFKSMVEAASGGDEAAAKLVAAYKHRPEWELYDCHEDPLEMNNIAEDPSHAERMSEMKSLLQQWMKAQGDKGLETERNSLLRQSKYKGKSLEQAEEIWEKRNTKRTRSGGGAK